MPDALAAAQQVLVAPITIVGGESWRRAVPYLSLTTVVWFPKLLAVQSGRIEYEVDGQTVSLKAGDVFLRPAWTRSRWRSVGKTPLRLAFVEFDFPTGGIAPVGPLVVPMPDAAAVVRGILSGVEKGSPSRLLVAAAELKLLLVRVLTATAGSSTGPAFTPSPLDAAVDRAMVLLRTELATADVASLPARVDVSPSRFRAAFRRRLGLSPQQYLLALRMRAARYYLADTSLPLKQVARSVGHDDPLYFSRIYRRFWGHPPTHDRRLTATGGRPPATLALLPGPSDGAPRPYRAGHAAR